MRTVIEKLTQAGFKDIKSNQFGADVQFINSYGEKVGLMVFPEVRYPKDVLMSMKWKHLQMYDKWYCLCNYNGYEKVSDAVGKEFCILKGAEFSNFCDEGKCR